MSQYVDGYLIPINAHGASPHHQECKWSQLHRFIFNRKFFKSQSYIHFYILSELLLKRNRFLKDNKVGVCLAGVIIFCEVMTEVGVQCGRVSAFKNRRMGQ